jgi:putative membrane protein
MMTLRKHTRLMAVLGACATLGACARGDDADTADTAAVGGAVTTDTAARATTVAWSDANILAYLHAADNNEIALGNLGARQATNARVKAFAQKMVREHRVMHNEGQALAQRLGISPAFRPSDDVNDVREDSAEVVRDLADEQKGAEFDEEYINKQIDLHKKVLDRIDDAIDDADRNSELKQLLQTARPKVEAHLREAEDIKNTLRS